MNSHNHHALSPQMRVQLMPWRRPTSSDASCWNAVGVRSMLPFAQPGHRSVTSTFTVLPSGPVTVTCLWQMGFLEEVRCQYSRRPQRWMAGT